VLGFAGEGFADFEDDIAIGGQYDGCDAVGLEGLPDCSAGGMDSFVEEDVLNRHKEVVCEHAQENVSFGPLALGLRVDFVRHNCTRRRAVRFSPPATDY